MVGNPTQLKTVAHILKTSQDMHIFPKEGNGKIFGRICSIKYCSLSILGGVLEIPLCLKSKVPNISHTKMKDFITLLYSYEW